MLQNMSEMLMNAKKEKYAVPHFNINNLEWTRFILEECEEQRTPVILGVSESAVKYMGGYNVVVALVTSLIKDLLCTIPVALHLDHGSSIESCKKAIDAGFSSVMIDASMYSLEENIQITKEVVLYAHHKNVTVEAEVGHIGGEEDGISSILAYAEVEDCVQFVRETNIDFLAPALGSVHGIYKGQPKLDFERMLAIKKMTNIPLVLHGGTGIPDDMVRRSIEMGICKLNINTELQIAWAEDIQKFIQKNGDVYDPRKIIKSGELALKKKVACKVKLLENSFKS